MVEKDIYEIRKIANAAGSRFPTLGYYVCAGPEGEVTHEIDANQITEINYTGKPGTASGIYYSLFFQLPKWDWHAEKAAEWIEVMPTHKEYYDRTMATKQMLESTIKTGLASLLAERKDERACVIFELSYNKKSNMWIYYCNKITDK